MPSYNTRKNGNHVITLQMLFQADLIQDFMIHILRITVCFIHQAAHQRAHYPEMSDIMCSAAMFYGTAQ